jgi:hypothetical protein
VFELVHREKEVNTTTYWPYGIDNVV